MKRPQGTPMRITPDIDDNIITAGKELAGRERMTTGNLVSDVMCEA